MKNNSKNIELNNRNYKTWKTTFKYTLFKNYLLKNNILFFYYDFIDNSIEDQNKLKLILKENNLKMIKIKKNTTLNLFNDTEYTEFKNIFKNNVFIIVSLNDKANEEIFLNKNLINSLINIKSIYFTGIWLNLKLYRPTEYLKLLDLKKDSKKNVIFLLKKAVNKLKTSLTFKITG